MPRGRKNLPRLPRGPRAMNGNGNKKRVQHVEVSQEEIDNLLRPEPQAIAVGEMAQPVNQPMPATSEDIKNDILRHIEHGEDFTAGLYGETDATQEAHLMGLVEALRSANLQFNRKYLILRLNYGEDYECMRHIHPGTLNHLRRLIDVVDRRAADDLDDFTDSDQAILMGLLHLQGYSLEWYKNELPHKAGGYFPYYNKSELDLSTFGIYHNEDEANYDDSCFITAAVNSGLFDVGEIDFMRSLIKTRYIPRDDLKFIAELFGITIYTVFYNEQRKKLDKPVIFNKGCERMLRLLIRCSHFMLYHDELVPPNKYDVHNLNTLLTRMLDDGSFELIEDVNHAERFMLHEFEFENLEYPANAVRLITLERRCFEVKTAIAVIVNDGGFVTRSRGKLTPSQLFNTSAEGTLIYLPNLQNVANMFSIEGVSVKPTIYRRTVQQIKLTDGRKTVLLRSFKSLTSISYEGSDINEFHELVKHVKTELQERLNLDLNDFNTLPNMAYAAAYNYGCFNGVYAVSGKVQAFAKRCIKGGLIRTLHDGCFEVNNVTCLDVNSSYGASMYNMSGLPRGAPKPFFSRIPDDSCYAFAQVNISNIENDELGRFGFVQEGINFVDSVLLDEIRTYVTCQIDVINGYYFNEGFNVNICDFAQILYELRQVDGLNKLGKNLLSSLFGKSLQNTMKYKIKMIPRNKLNSFLAEFGNYVYEITKARGDMLTVKLLRSVDSNFNVPHFGVQVLSESRRRVNRTIAFCHARDISLFSIKTDSFTIPSEKVDEITQLTPISNELGCFKVEYVAKHIKFTSASCYRAELVDGSTRMRGKVK